ALAGLAASAGVKVTAAAHQGVEAKTLDGAVGDPAFCDAAEVDTRTGREAPTARCDLEKVRESRYRRRSTRWSGDRHSGDLIEGPVVPGGQERRKDSGVDQAPALLKGVERCAQQLLENRGHLHPRPSPRVEARQLAVGLESRESIVKPADPLRGRV